MGTGAEFARHHAVAGTVSRQERKRYPFVLQRPTKRETGAAAQIDIQDRAIDPLALEDFQPSGDGRCRSCDRISKTADQIADCLRDKIIVLDDENARQSRIWVGRHSQRKDAVVGTVPQGAEKIQINLVARMTRSRRRKTKGRGRRKDASSSHRFIAAFLRLSNMCNTARGRAPSEEGYAAGLLATCQAPVGGRLRGCRAVRECAER